jgi:hypothetical protein
LAGEMSLKGLHSGGGEPNAAAAPLGLWIP